MIDTKVRSKGVGGSEVAAILGLDEYSSPYKVWLSKTGRESSSVDNKFTRAGVILESAVAEFFQTQTKYKIIKSSADQKTYFHPKFDFVLGTPDRIYVANSQVGKGVLECKTTQNCFDDVPQKWFVQLQWYLGIRNMMYGSVAWLERGLDFKYKEFEYDPEFFKWLVDAVSKFWYENVLKDVPPDPINIDDIKSMYRRHSEGVIIDATPDLIMAHDELQRVREVLSELEIKKEALENSVKMTMRDAESVMNENKTLFTWKATKASLQFDKDRFKVEQPELYSQYQKEIEGSRRFLIK